MASVGRPIPIVHRMNRSDPRRSEIDWRPLCPPVDPLLFSLPSPTGRSSVSQTTSSSPIEKSKRSKTSLRTSPLLFMNVSGSTSAIRAIPPAQSAARYRRNQIFRSLTPYLRARLSTNQNPTLCRVSLYSRPGFPRPKTSRSRATPRFRLRLRRRPRLPRVRVLRPLPRPQPLPRPRLSAL